MGLPLPTLFYSELIAMTVTVTDPDFKLYELDWKLLLQTVYGWVRLAILKSQRVEARCNLNPRP